MRSGAVAFVFCESVGGIFFIECQHEPVAGDFGNHACGCNAETEAIAADQRRLFDGKWAHGQPVNEDVRGF